MAQPCAAADVRSDARAAGAPAATTGRVRGVVLSTHTDGSDWASPGAATAMDDMRAIGANWVSIHPYARIEADGTVRFGRFNSHPENVAVPIRDAHARGLKICIQPHLAYWGTPFRWQGDIGFSTVEEWDRFWTGYTQWILAVVEACPDADAFVLGTELDRTVEHEACWRALIGTVRARTHAPLTYGANWSEYTRVRFWDALDAIGVQAYFPLTDSTDVTPLAIAAGWSKHMADLRRFARQEDRPIVFTELGYNCARMASVRPWDDRVDGPEAEPIQEACLRAALRAIEAEPSVVGAFLWKWFPNPDPVEENFQVASPHLKRIVAEVWQR